MKAISGQPFFCSWSGGKDSCFALYRAIRAGGIPQALLTMMMEDGERSRAHGLSVEVLQGQADALGIPLVTRQASWDTYEAEFLSAIRQFREEGITRGIFGDIDLEPHLEWVERVCSSASIQAYEPLWQEARRDLLDEFLQLSFKATIIAIKQEALDDSFLGRTLDRQVIADLEKAGVDASGEEGEYHTVVTNGPIFSSTLHLEMKEQVIRDGYCFLDVSLSNSEPGRNTFLSSA
ncbi:MAG: diphthine--ammonia ligase [Anaerolineae bacterium]|nr:diphthine--ammonia ligase [Anaerolineae bacterium]